LFTKSGDKLNSSGRIENNMTATKYLMNKDESLV